MGNFLIVLSDEQSRDKARGIFDSGLRSAASLKGQTRSSTLERDGVLAASFQRQNGSGSPITVDPGTGSWLLAAGTWFHPSAKGPDKEKRLLERSIEIGFERVTDEMEGFFALALGDPVRNETVIATDLVGSCHCFVRTWPGVAAVAGSSIVLSAISDCEIDPVACQEFLCTGVVYEDRTLYREIRKLGPASFYHFRRGKLETVRRYWDVSYVDPDSLSGPEAVREFAEKLVGAGRRIGASCERPVCDLTGGYDSRLLVAALMKAGFPFSTVVTGHPNSPDVVVSKGLAGIAELRHLHLSSGPVDSHQQLLNALQVTDGEYDIVEYARVWDIHHRLSQEFGISLNGSFGEVARGYWWELLFPSAGAHRALDSAKIARLRFAAGNYDTSLFPSRTRLDLASHFTEVIDRTNRGLAGLPNSLQLDNVYLMMRMQRWQGRIASSTNQIWPCLSPFLFRSVLESMLRTATHLRRRGLLARQTIAKLEPRFASYPLEHGYPPVPFSLRTSYRFLPLVKLYAKKSVSRLASRAGMRWPPSSRATSDQARLNLWQNGVAAEILQCRKMISVSVLDADALDRFLAWSRQPDFPYNGQWGRLLSMEMALRKGREAWIHSRKELTSNGGSGNSRNSEET